MVTLQQVEKFVREEILARRLEEIMARARIQATADGMIPVRAVVTFLGDRTDEFIEKSSNDLEYIRIATEHIQVHLVEERP